MILVLLIIVIVANFIFQALHKREWEAAIERSYFQAIAVGVIWFELWLIK